MNWQEILKIETVACPFCYAISGEPCKTITSKHDKGKYIRIPHKERRRIKSRKQEIK